MICQGGVHNILELMSDVSEERDKDIYIYIYKTLWMVKQNETVHLDHLEKTS